MNWKFWQKEKNSENPSGTREVKLAKPKGLPDQVGMYLVTQLKLDPDWVWSLKCAMRSKANEKNVFEIRIFDPVTAVREGVAVSNFNALDQCPNMILFSGSYNKNTGRVQIEKTLENAA